MRACLPLLSFHVRQSIPAQLLIVYLVWKVMSTNLQGTECPEMLGGPQHVQFQQLQTSESAQSHIDWNPSCGEPVHHMSTKEADSVSRADCCSTPCTPPSLNSSPDGLCGLLETTAFFDQSSLALCSASRLLTTAHDGIPVFYNWLGVFCLGFQIQSCIFQKWAVSSKQLMLVRLCGLDNQEEPFDFLT